MWKPGHGFFLYGAAFRAEVVGGNRFNFVVAALVF